MRSKAEISKNADAKIRQAEEHIDRLEEKVDTYLATGPVTFMRSVDAEKAIRKWYFVEQSPIPEGIYTTFGDAIHNIRSALDVVMYSALQGTSASRADIKFPVGRTYDQMKYEQTANNAQAAKGSLTLRDTMYGMRAYPGGNQDLVDLHFLDLMDKHRVLVSAINEASMSVQDWHAVDPCLKRFFGGVGTIILVNSTIEEQLPESPFLRTAKFPTELQPKFTVSLRAEDYDGVAIAICHTGLPAVEACRQLLASASAAVSKIAAAAV